MKSKHGEKVALTLATNILLITSLLQVVFVSKASPTTLYVNPATSTANPGEYSTINARAEFAQDEEREVP